MTTGQHRHAARIAAIEARNWAIYANTPPDRVTRQQLRAIARQRPTGTYRRGGFIRGRIAPPDLFNSRILKTWVEGRREYAFHATKGLRVRRK